jgi:hypothetical protein
VPVIPMLKINGISFARQNIASKFNRYQKLPVSWNALPIFVKGKNINTHIA